MSDITKLKKVTIISRNESIRNRFSALIQNIKPFWITMNKYSIGEMDTKNDLLEINYVFIDIDFFLEKEKRFYRKLVKNALKADCKVIGVTQFNNYFFPYTYFQLPLTGYIRKRISLTELIKVLKITEDGGKYINNRLNNILVKYISGNTSRGKLDALNENELLLLQEISEGSSVSEMATMFCDSTKSIESYIASIYKKLQIDPGDLTGLFKLISEELSIEVKS